MSKICCIFNIAPHYNSSIYKKMDEEFECAFYLGDRISEPLQLMNYKELSGYKKTLKYTPLFCGFYRQQGAVRNLFRSYNRYVLTGEPFNLSVWCILLGAIFSKKKVFLWTHGWYGRESFLRKVVKKLFFKMADGVFLYGEYAKKLMIQENINASKLFVIYNSLDYDKQIVIRNDLKKNAIHKDFFKNDNYNIVFIGRLTQSKKIDMLLRALPILNKSKYKFNLTLIGDGTIKEDLIQLVEELGITSNVRFVGALYNDVKISEFIFNSDICVSPGNVGLTAIHSLTFGTPVITHDDFPNQGPEFEAIKKGVTGDYFVSDNIESLCLCIESWIDLYPIKNNDLINNCHAIIEQKYNPNKQINLLKEVLL